MKSPDIERALVELKDVLSVKATKELRKLSTKIGKETQARFDKEIEELKRFGWDTLNEIEVLK